MKIVVFGATGGTGKNVVSAGLAAGHDVVAVARKPESVAQQERLVVVKGDVLDAPSVAAALAGADAVVIAIGPSDEKNPGTLISTGVKHILDGCATHGVTRVVFESGLMMSDGSELSLIGRLGIKFFGALRSKLRDDKRIAEEAIRARPIEWVIVRPPQLTHTPATGSYIAGPRMTIAATRSLSHADVAHALIRATAEPAWTRQIINVGHP